MAVGRKRIRDNLQRIGENIAAAAGRAQRDPGGVRLVVVTKSADLDDVRTLIELGQRDLGENRVQQLLARAEEIGPWVDRRRKDSPAELRWHMVGHLQRNKVKALLSVSRIIHSVDTLPLAEEISERAAASGVTPDIMLEVNCSEEPQKFGVAVGAVAGLADQVCTLGNLRLAGLMTMAPLVRDPEKARPTFARLREVFEDLRSERLGGRHLTELSMGMSQDYAVAVEEGATILRVGTAVFACPPAER